MTSLCLDLASPITHVTDIRLIHMDLTCTGNTEGTQEKTRECRRYIRTYAQALDRP
jgi:hypothetical protein